MQQLEAADWLDQAVACLALAQAMYTVSNTDSPGDAQSITPALEAAIAQIDAVSQRLLGGVAATAC